MKKFILALDRHVTGTAFFVACALLAIVSALGYPLRTGLTVGASYSFTVRASNEAGTSASWVTVG